MVRLAAVAVGDEPAALRALGLDVDVDGRATVGGVTLLAAGEASGEGIVGLDLRDDDGSALDAGQLRTVTVTPGGPSSHPLGAVAVDHVVVLAGDVLGAIAAAGMAPRRVEERGDRRYAYVVTASALLEFVGPVEADDRPPRCWGLALSVADLDAAATLLGPGLGPVKDAFQPGRRVATVRHEVLGLSVPTVLLTPR